MEIVDLFLGQWTGRHSPKCEEKLRRFFELLSRVDCIIQGLSSHYRSVIGQQHHMVPRCELADGLGQDKIPGSEVRNEWQRADAPPATTIRLKPAFCSRVARALRISSTFLPASRVPYVA